MSETKYYLAVDIGASSGRHILAHMEDGKIICEEIYRFYNGNDLLLADGTNAGPADGQKMPEGAHRVWNTERLFVEILAGMRACKEAGKIPFSMSIDTWAVDYVLLDKEGKPAAPCYAYRDSRTNGMDESVYKIIPEAELYARTGIQKAAFNTIYQLMAAKFMEPEALERAQALLMIPDYFNFLLTGVMCQEYTNATTTQLVSPVTFDWDLELIRMLGLPARLFQKIKMPGTYIGDLTSAVQQRIGFNCRVVLPATHDTGSAVMSVPSEENDVLYISSGTWSLLGCELMQADCSEKARAANFTNEGGYGHRFRFLKNIMGLWMIQSVQKEFKAAAAAPGRLTSSGRSAPEQISGRDADAAGYFMPSADGDCDYSFEHLCERAAQEQIDSLVDANDVRFLAPASMIREIQTACAENRQPVPETPWEIARVIYRSLAQCYREAIEELEEITGINYKSINIVGGGSNARWLNELTAEVTGRHILAGPGEATAIGCLGAQLIADGVFTDLKDFRRCVKESFAVKEYMP